MKLYRMQKQMNSILVLFLTVLVLLVSGCGSDTPDMSLHESDQPVVVFNGFSLPKFPTARGQLNYARSGFTTQEKKKAAFEFVLRHFPLDRAECGEAVLNLAYMNFGFDYRFALLQDYHNAIEEYKTIIKYYADQPEVMAKAYWYLGWIYCELLDQKENGIFYFWRIVSEYPQVHRGISSPVPWVSLVYPEKPSEFKPRKEKIVSKWAGIALLEIIRHSDETDDVLNAFDRLWEEYRKSISTGLAIKLLLADKQYLQKVKPYVHEYLALNIANVYLAKELTSAAKEEKP